MSDNDYCLICSQPCTESNLLLNGARYHLLCLEKLKSYETVHDEDINALHESLSDLSSEIRLLLDQRNIFQKLFGVIPESFGGLKEKEEKLNQQISDLKKEKHEILRTRKIRLTAIYDYWLTRPPDWHRRSKMLLTNIDRCRNCNKYPTRYNPLQVHHITPISHGGNHTVQNLKVLCFDCHQDEHPFEIGGFNRSRSLGQSKGSRIEDIIKKLEQAKTDSLYISFNYRRFEGILDKHLVEGEKLISKEDGLYFTGFCYLSNTKRDFKLKNVSAIVLKDVSSLKKLPSYFVKEALDKELFIYCHYTKRTGGKSLRTLRPIRYTHYHGVKVLNCFDYLTMENRNFALHRMKNIEIVQEPKESKIITGTP